MSFSLEITYKGVKGSQNALNAFEQELAQEVLDKLEDKAVQVVNEMQTLVPVDTGALLESIGYEVDPTGQVKFFAGEDYAGFVEYGTKNMEPQPYFNPPLDKLRAEANSDMGGDALALWNRLVSQHKGE